MLYNIFKNIAPEKWFCYAMWGVDVQSLLTLIQEYYTNITGKTLVIPTSPFKMKFKMDAQFIHISKLQDNQTPGPKLVILAEQNIQNEIIPFTLEQILRTDQELFKKFDRVIFINLLKNDPILNDFFKNLKIKNRLFPQTGLIITAADRYHRTFLIPELQSEELSGKRFHPLQFKLEELTRMNLFPLFVIFLNVSTVARANEITLTGKELITKGITGIVYYMDDHCHIIGARV